MLLKIKKLPQPKRPTQKRKEQKRHLLFDSFYFERLVDQEQNQQQCLRQVI
jgi:hypothetical protein